MSECGNDPRNDLSILMLADQHVSARPSVAERNHELLSVPEGQDNVLALLIQRIHLFVPARLDPHRSTKRADHRRTNRRKERKFEPGFNRLQ